MLQRQHSSPLREKLKQGGQLYIERMKAELSTKVHAAIQKFITDKMTVALDVVGLTGDMTPFVTQITQESTDFRTSHRASQDGMFGVPNASADGVSQPAIRHADHDVQASSPHVPPDVPGAIQQPGLMPDSRCHSKRGEDRS